MGEPYFKVKELVKKNKVHIFSSNYALYGDLSRRVMKTLKSFSDKIEIYSIDEAFVDLSHIKEEAENNGLTKAKLVEVVIRSTRHVLTTSATTIGGFLPLLFASMFFRPLAWGMVVGVIGSSIIAVFYIPAMFIYLKKIQS